MSLEPAGLVGHVRLYTQRNTVFSELRKIDCRQVHALDLLYPPLFSSLPLLLSLLLLFSFSSLSLLLLFCPPFPPLFISTPFFLLFPSLLLLFPASFPLLLPTPSSSPLTTTGPLPGGGLPLCCSAQLQTSFPLHCTCLLCLSTKTLLFPWQQEQQLQHRSGRSLTERVFYCKVYETCCTGIGPFRSVPGAFSLHGEQVPILQPLLAPLLLHITSL